MKVYFKDFSDFDRTKKFDRIAANRVSQRDLDSRNIVVDVTGVDDERQVDEARSRVEKALNLSLEGFEPKYSDEYHSVSFSKSIGLEI